VRRGQVEPLRVVLDSSVVVAALATPNPESASRVVLAAAAAGLVQLFITDELEAEYRRAVEYPQVRKYATKVDRQAFVSGVVAIAVKVEAAEAAGAVPADPGDDLVVAAVIGAKAEYLASFDPHLTGLGRVGGARVVRPGALLAVIRALQA
jgi:predicted nucleic acid-binding protein